MSGINLKPNRILERSKVQPGSTLRFSPKSSQPTAVKNS